MTMAAAAMYATPGWLMTCGERRHKKIMTSRRIRTPYMPVGGKSVELLYFKAFFRGNSS